MYKLSRSIRPSKARELTRRPPQLLYSYIILYEGGGLTKLEQGFSTR